MENEFEKKTNYEIGYCSPPISPGRKPGVPNKSTIAAREAIAMFIENNVHRLQEWLDMVAHGYKYINPKGEEVLVPPNPIKAHEMVCSIIEYHIPKLKSTEIKATIDETKQVTLRTFRVVKTIEGKAIDGNGNPTR